MPSVRGVLRGGAPAAAQRRDQARQREARVQELQHHRPQSNDAAAASLAAAEQERYFEFIETFYANQGRENSGYVTDEFLDAIAKAAGVTDLDKFNADRAGPAIADKVAAVQDEAAKLGLNATPSFVVSGPGGSKKLVAPSLDELRQAIGEVG